MNHPDTTGQFMEPGHSLDDLFPPRPAGGEERCAAHGEPLDPNCGECWDEFWGRVDRGEELFW